MTTARSMQIDLNQTRFYHCHTRCVRRAFLCGEDKETGRDYGYRKQWLLDRMKFLSGVFSIKVAAYAIMSNHYHLVLYVDPDVVDEWDDREVLERWSLIFPRDASFFDTMSKRQKRAKLSEWRKRLFSISWFMRCMNEDIAKRVNKEDNCTGHFWQSRFKTHALLGISAAVAAMIYVDLNPIRSHMAETPEDSEFTSIQERIEAYLAGKRNKSSARQANGLMPIDPDVILEGLPFDLSLEEYIHMVERYGRVQKEGKGCIPESCEPILRRLGVRADQWMTMVNCFGSHRFNVIGNHKALENFQRGTRVNLPKGYRMSKRCYL